MEGSFTARSIIKNPEIAARLDQKYIIVYDRNVNDVGIAINIMAEQNWKVKECWGVARYNVLFEKS
jgi:hypothetical protein